MAVTMEPLVSIILPTRDRTGLLARALASIAAQTECRWELLIIDNNQTEGPILEQEGLTRWLRDSRVRVLSQPAAQNAAVARNSGLAAAHAPWITYLDDDDAYRPAKLAAQLALAQARDAGLVLCGAEFHLRGRRRRVQCQAEAWSGDELILKARWNTPLLFHRHPGLMRFDETLSPGEDAEFAHRLILAMGLDRVPVVRAPLVDVYPQPGARVNADPAPVMAAANKILALRTGFYPARSRRRYLLQNELAVAKLTRRSAACLRLSLRLLHESRGADWRPVANAIFVSLGWRPGSWVS